MAQFVTLLPEGASLAHAVTVRRQEGPTRDARRRSVELDEHRRVVGGALAGAFVAVDGRVRHARGE